METKLFVPTSSIMIVPPEVFLDALAFADFDTRLRMLLLSRHLNAVVDANRDRLHLPKACIFGSLGRQC